MISSQRFAVLVAGFPSRSSAHQADWQALKVLRYCGPLCNLKPPPPLEKYQFTLCQIAGGKVTIPSLHMMGETDKVEEKFSPFCLVQMIYTWVLQPGYREGNEWGVVAVLWEVLSKTCFICAMTGIIVDLHTYFQPPRCDSWRRSPCARHWEPKDFDARLPQRNAGVLIHWKTWSWKLLTLDINRKSCSASVGFSPFSPIQHYSRRPYWTGLPRPL